MKLLAYLEVVEHSWLHGEPPTVTGRLGLECRWRIQESNRPAAQSLGIFSVDARDCLSVATARMGLEKRSQCECVAREQIACGPTYPQIQAHQHRRFLADGNTSRSEHLERMFILSREFRRGTT